MKLRIQKHLALLFFFLLCYTAASYARVFMRWGSVPNSTASMKALHGKAIYNAPVTINGGQGDLTIFSFERNMKDVLTDIKATFDIKNLNTSDGSLATASIEKDNTALRFIALRPNNNEQTLVFKIEQSLAAAALTKTIPQQHLMNDIPSYPGSKPVFYMKDDNTGAGISISTTYAPADAVNAYFDSLLTSSGWLQPLGPTPRESMLINHHGMHVYIKNNQISCITTSTSSSGATTITLLHKTQKME